MFWDERDETRREGSHLFLNLGIYGVPKAILEDRGFKTVLAVRELEGVVRQVGGFQHTYCDSFQTESEFETMYNHKLWKHCRDKVRCHRHISIYFRKNPSKRYRH